ncbi:YwiC-like family protein [Cellulomonas massiliensis]|uniref:YwiC-like family protein n=1 Tax=Cellulomonas massiliensis TaxID=1465811 RepID=UPI0002E35016|nr:YwiC-like family protein [Cellulomonas massiliensis]
MSTTTRPSTRRRRPGPGWVPKEHGAWAMLVVPVLVGALVGGPTWRHALLLVAWLLAYLAFHATGLWLRASRRPRYLPPVRAYAVALLVVGGALLASAPALLRWGPVYAVLLATSLVCSQRRADRSWLNDAVTVGAATLMTVVAAGLGAHGTPTAVAAALPWAGLPGAGDPAVRAATAVLGAYFLGTVPYVKTLLRERGDPTVLLVSVLFHALLVVAALAAAVALPLGASPALPATAVGLLLRAVLVPRRRPWPSARSIGLGEVAATLVVTLVALVVAASI